jgi:hypothetical protein
MEPEHILPCSQHPATGPYPKPDDSSPNISNLIYMFHSNNNSPLFMEAVPSFRIFR